FVVARTDPVRVAVQVPEADAVRVSKGAGVVVRIPALEQQFEGKVTRVAGVFDPRTGTLRAEIDLPNPTDSLRPGMFATVTVAVEAGESRKEEAPRPAG